MIQTLRRKAGSLGRSGSLGKARGCDSLTQYAVKIYNLFFIVKFFVQRVGLRKSALVVSAESNHR